MCHYLIDVPQDQPALALGELQGGRSPDAVASARDEHQLPAQRLSPGRHEQLHKSLQVGVEERGQKQQELHKHIHCVPGALLRTELNFNLFWGDAGLLLCPLPVSVRAPGPGRSRRIHPRTARTAGCSAQLFQPQLPGSHPELPESPLSSRGPCVRVPVPALGDRCGGAAVCSLRSVFPLQRTGPAERG